MLIAEFKPNPNKPTTKSITPKIIQNTNNGFFIITSPCYFLVSYCSGLLIRGFSPLFFPT